MKSSIKKAISVGLILCVLSVMAFFMICLNVAAQSELVENGSPIVNGSPIENSSPEVTVSPITNGSPVMTVSPIANASPIISPPPVDNGSPVTSVSPNGTHGNATMAPISTTPRSHVNDASNMPIVLFGGVVSMVVVVAAAYLMLFKNK